ncbi:MAG: winged helix-turn-helix transcriptional regulator [Bacteroidetes bacterium]|nr:winged helix-turn-helix transcriptional regulator [Bacteroidota bacterium]
MDRYNYDPFHAIADPGRRNILMMLTKEKLSINAIADNFDISRPAVSKHIKILYEAGFIAISEEGRERYCELSPKGFEEVKEWIVFFEQFWKQKMLNLEKLLIKRSNKKPKK